MFRFVGGRINPVVGCRYGCVYCWARRLVRRFKRLCERCYEFTPHTHMERLYTPKRGVFRRMPPDSVVFVCDLADLFGSWVSPSVIVKVLDFVRFNPQTVFFLETKNPSGMRCFMDEVPENTIVSVTIETNRYPEDGVSKAPPPEDRFKEFRRIDHPRKHVSIEPIIDFDMEVLLEWMRDIQPEMVSIGYDNYGILRRCGIPEPSREKYFRFKAELSKFTRVEDKTFGG